jgi:hypothetical protein
MQASYKPGRDSSLHGWCSCLVQFCDKAIGRSILRRGVSEVTRAHLMTVDAALKCEVPQLLSLTLFINIYVSVINKWQ